LRNKYRKGGVFSRGDVSKKNSPYGLFLIIVVVDGCRLLMGELLLLVPVACPQVLLRMNRQAFHGNSD
jgi:hypothetical protein